MASPIPKAAIGTQLWIGDDESPEYFTRVGRIGDVSGPNVTADTIETTTHDTEDLEGGYKEFITSLKDGGEVTFPIMFDPTSEEHNESATDPGVAAGGLKYLIESREKRNMRLVLPSSPKYRLSFKGVLTQWGGDFKVQGAMMANITIKVSGRPVLEVGIGNV